MLVLINFSFTIFMVKLRQNLLRLVYGEIIHTGDESPAF